MILIIKLNMRKLGNLNSVTKIYNNLALIFHYILCILFTLMAYPGRIAYSGKQHAFSYQSMKWHSVKMQGATKTKFINNVHCSLFINNVHEKSYCM